MPVTPGGDAWINLARINLKLEAKMFRTHSQNDELLENFQKYFSNNIE
jgi:hypothetical protein